MADPVAQYLARYAESSVGWTGALKGQWSRALVVPAHDEEPNWIEGLGAARAARGDVLLIVVANRAPEADAGAWARTQAMVDAWGARGPITQIDRDTVVIDLVLPAGQGVGLARKIGADLALALWHEARIREPWIHCSDADVVLPTDYFEADDPTAVGLLYPFWHVASGDEALDRATALYELWLRYYAQGLRFAGSPHAWTALGSVIAVRAPAYAMVRGFPRRRTGEDFYLVSKLGAVGSLARVCSSPIEIRSRWSSRVPVGTGPAAAKIAAVLGRGEVPEFYNPRVFMRLAAVLTALNQRGECDDPQWVAMGGPAGLASALRGASNATTRRRRISTWLGALRTLQLIHRFEQDPRCHRLPWPDAIANASFIPSSGSVDELRRALLAAH